MKTSSVAVAFASAVVGVSALYSNASTTWVTDVVTAFTTVCPEATLLTYGEQTYTVTESTTLTITNCPCTISKPVVVTSAVYCNSCGPTTLYPNTTVYVAPASGPATAPVATITYATPYGTNAPIAPSQYPVVPTDTPSGASRHVALSGAALVGLLGFAVFAL